MNKWIEEDLFRRTGRKPSFKLFITELYIPQFRFVFLKRKCEKYRNSNKVFFIFWRLIYEHYKIKYGIDIPAKVKIGHGFRIGHIGGIVVNPDTIIGNNVDIYNGVTIGATFRGNYQGVPKIGNNVWIGPNTIIVGNITIGDDVLIAPGSYINKSIPSHSVVYSSQSIYKTKENATESYINNCIKDNHP